MKLLAEVIVIAFGVSQVVDTWMRGDIFVRGRDRALKWAYQGKYAFQRGFGQLLSCAFCLSHWVAFVAVTACVFPEHLAFVRWFFVALAVVRIARFVEAAQERLEALGGDSLPDPELGGRFPDAGSEGPEIVVEELD